MSYPLLNKILTSFKEYYTTNMIVNEVDKCNTCGSLSCQTLLLRLYIFFLT